MPPQGPPTYRGFKRYNPCGCGYRSIARQCSLTLASKMALAANCKCKKCLLPCPRPVHCGWSGDRRGQPVVNELMTRGGLQCRCCGLHTQCMAMTALLPPPYWQTNKRSRHISSNLTDRCQWCGGGVRCMQKCSIHVTKAVIRIGCVLYGGHLLLFLDSAQQIVKPPN